MTADLTTALTDPLPRLSPDQSWFAIEPWGQDGGPEIFRLYEPHAHRFMRANIWLIRGRDRDLLVDAGNGVTSLKAALAPFGLRDPLMIATHAHADHIGSLHEFAEVWAHRSIAQALATLDPDATLIEPGYRVESMSALKMGDERLTAPLAEVLPADFDPHRFGPRPVVLARALADGDTVDLGDIRLQALHLPGHSPGCMALFDPQSGLLIAGDVVYEGMLVDSLHHSDRRAYRESLTRLAGLPVRRVLAGHNLPFDGERLAQIIAAYLAKG